MQINSVNQSISYSKINQNRNVKNFSKNNQPSFGKLLKLETERFHNISTEVELASAKIVRAIMEEKELQDFFKSVNGIIKVQFLTNQNYPLYCTVEKL